MNDRDFNIYRIDDILIRAGYGCLLLFVLFGGTIVLKAAQGAVLVNAGSMYAAAAAFGTPAFIFLPVGYAVRRLERTAAVVWRKLHDVPEVPAEDLMAGTGFSRERVEKALLAINRRGRGLYVWDKNTGLIADARLRQGMILVENCERCGARIGKRYPVSLDRAPSCPYCGNPLNMERWNDLKRRVIDDMKRNDLGSAARDAAVHAAYEKTSFSKPVFIILLILFWPAGLIYALVKYNGR